MYSRTMTDDAPKPVLTPEKVRDGRWIFLGVFVAVFIGVCGLAYRTWGDARGRTRFEAEVAFVSIVGLGVPILTASMVKSVRARRMGKRWSASRRSAVFGAALLLVPVLEHASWQLVVWSSFAAFVLAYTVSMGVLFLMLSPEEEVVRRHEAGLD
jgi:uncharacterized membrane protein